MIMMKVCSIAARARGCSLFLGVGVWSGLVGAVEETLGGGWLLIYRAQHRHASRAAGRANPRAPEIRWAQPEQASLQQNSTAFFFNFCIFQKKNVQKYIFGFRFYSFVPLPPGRGPTAQQGGGRDLYVNKNKFIFRRGPWREPAAPLPGGRPLPPH